MTLVFMLVADFVNLLRMEEIMREDVGRKQKKNDDYNCLLKPVEPVPSPVQRLACVCHLDGTQIEGVRLVTEL